MNWWQRKFKNAKLAWLDKEERFFSGAEIKARSVSKKPFPAIVMLSGDVLNPRLHSIDLGEETILDIGKHALSAWNLTTKAIISADAADKDFTLGGSHVSSVDLKKRNRVYVTDSNVPDLRLEACTMALLENVSGMTSQSLNCVESVKVVSCPDLQKLEAYAPIVTVVNNPNLEENDCPLVWDYCFYGENPNLHDTDNMRIIQDLRDEKGIFMCIALTPDAYLISDALGGRAHGPRQKLPQQCAKNLPALTKKLEDLKANTASVTQAAQTQLMTEIGVAQQKFDETLGAHHVKIKETAAVITKMQNTVETIRALVNENKDGATKIATVPSDASELKL